MAIRPFINRKWFGRALLKITYMDVLVLFCAIALAVLVRKLLLNDLGTRIVWVTFYPAVAISSLYRGWHIGLASALASCLVVYFAWPLFVSRPFIIDAADWLGMFAFLFNSIVISIVSDIARRAQLKAIRAKEQAEASNATTAVLSSLDLGEISKLPSPLVKELEDMLINLDMIGISKAIQGIHLINPPLSDILKIYTKSSNSRRCSRL